MSARGGRFQRRFDRRQLRITTGALILLFLEVGLSLTYLMLDADGRMRMGSYLVASTDLVWSELHLWALVTSPLVEIDFVSLLFHALILWLFVPTLERWWGTRKFLIFAAYTSVVGTLAGTLAGLAFGDGGVVAGLDPFIYGSIVAFGVLYGDHQVQFFGVLPMKGRQLMYGIIGFVALFVVLGQQWSLGAAFAASMVLAWLLTSGRWNPRLWMLKWKQKRVRRHLKLVRDEEPKKWVN